MSPSRADRPPLVRRLTIDDVGDVIALQRIVADGLPAGYLFPKTEDALRGYLDGARGAAWGIVAGGGLLAVALLRLPGSGQELSGPSFPHVPPGEVGRSCFLENDIVHPDARGRGYHRRLLDARLAAAAQLGRGWVCAGAHLENRRSWANLLAAGLVIVGIRLDLGYPVIGLLRAPDPRVLATDAGSARLIAISDTAGHEAAQQDGWVGVRLQPDGRVLYRRLTSRGPGESA